VLIEFDANGGNSVAWREQAKGGKSYREQLKRR
jgi:hypothetical protein